MRLNTSTYSTAILCPGWLHCADHCSTASLSCVQSSLDGESTDPKHSRASGDVSGTPPTEPSTSQSGSLTPHRVSDIPPDITLQDDSTAANLDADLKQAIKVEDDVYCQVGKSAQLCVCTWI